MDVVDWLMLFWVVRVGVVESFLMSYRSDVSYIWVLFWLVIDFWGFKELLIRSCVIVR